MTKSRSVNASFRAVSLVPVLILGFVLLAPAAPPADAKPEKPKALAPAGLGLAGDMKVASDSLDTDFSNRLSTFTGHVVVTDPRMTLKADKIMVTFGAGHEWQRIVATGKVTIDQPDLKRQAKAGRAEYDVVKGVIVLTGNPTLVSGESTLTGAEKITYYRDEERVSTEGGRATINSTSSPAAPLLKAGKIQTPSP